MSGKKVTFGLWSGLSSLVRSHELKPNQPTLSRYRVGLGVELGVATRSAGEFRILPGLGFEDGYT